jgi:hypothetical protein
LIKVKGKGNAVLKCPLLDSGDIQETLLVQWPTNLFCTSCLCHWRSILEHYLLKGVRYLYFFFTFFFKSVGGRRLKNSVDYRINR